MAKRKNQLDFSSIILFFLLINAAYYVVQFHFIDLIHIESNTKQTEIHNLIDKISERDFKSTDFRIDTVNIETKISHQPLSGKEKLISDYLAQRHEQDILILKQGLNQFRNFIFLNVACSFFILFYLYLTKPKDKKVKIESKSASSNSQSSQISQQSNISNDTTTS